TRRPRVTIKAHKGGITTLAFSPDGKLLATGGFDGLVKVWDPDNAQLKVRFHWQAKQITSLIFLNDSRTLVSASSEGLVQFWDTASEPPPQVLAGWKGHFDSILFSTDSTILGADSAGYVRSVDLGTAAFKSQLTPNEDEARVHITAISPDGR